MARLREKVAIVTGAGQGVGLGIARALAREGAAIVIAEINPETGPAAAREIEELGAKAVAVLCDVAKREDVGKTVQTAIEAFGGIDILVNCAHDLRDIQKPFMEVTDEEIYRQFGSGLMGTVYFMRACFPYFKDKGGKIINIGSAAGVHGEAGFLGYNLTKEAIRATTRTVAREWGALGINVNTICPLGDSPTMKAWSSQPELGWGVVRSTLPIPRLGRCEEDIGRVAVFLASNDADYMTGSTLMVDGGAMMDAGR